MHQKSVFSEELLTPSREIVIDGVKLRYYEEGQGQPVLFLHGIPTHSYLWRNVLPGVGSHARALALDLAGFGASEVPSDGDFSVTHHVKLLRGFVRALGLSELILAVNDLGSLVGVKFAIENPEWIRGVVLIEAVFMPARPWYAQLTLQQKLMFPVMRIPAIARVMIVTWNLLPSMMMRIAVRRKLSSGEMQAYCEPYRADERRRKVLLEGPGPATFPKGGKVQVPGDFADELNKNAEGLVALSQKVPFLLIHGTPGMIARKAALDYAQRSFARLRLHAVGKGKHFLSEDSPLLVTEGILRWMGDNGWTKDDHGYPL